MQKRRETEDIDEIFAEHFGTNEEERALLMELMRSARDGHLCLQKIRPITSSLIQKVDATTVFFDRLIAEWGDAYYMQRNWVLEALIARALKRLLSRSVKPLDIKTPNDLHPDQRRAVSLALRSGIVAITGGPGTGKTYLISQLISLFLAEQPGRIVLAAPTGKAVGQLKKYLLKEMKVFASRIAVGTLHFLLHIKTEEDLLWATPRLDAEMVIVDESSMVDAALWRALLQAIGPTTRLILVGDQEQLPPVGTGTLFGEICQYFFQANSLSLRKTHGRASHRKSGAFAVSSKNPPRALPGRDCHTRTDGSTEVGYPFSSSPSKKTELRGAL